MRRPSSTPILSSCLRYPPPPGWGGYEEAQLHTCTNFMPEISPPRGFKSEIRHNYTNLNGSKHANIVHVIEIHVFYSIHPSIHLVSKYFGAEKFWYRNVYGYLEVWYRIVLMLKRLGPYRVPFYYLFPIYGYSKFIFGHVWISIFHFWISKKSIYGYPKIHFWISKNQLITGYP